MTNYRRLISYIYAYEGEVKGKNIGFAKMEARNGQCKLSVNVKKVYVGSSDLGVYLLAPGREIFLGSIFIRGGSGEFRVALAVDNTADSGCCMDQCYGLTIHEKGESWRSYTTIWEDAVAQAAELELAQVTSEYCGNTDEQIHKKIEELDREMKAQEQDHSGIKGEMPVSFVEPEGVEMPAESGEMENSKKNPFTVEAAAQPAEAVQMEENIQMPETVQTRENAPEEREEIRCKLSDEEMEGEQNLRGQMMEGRWSKSLDQEIQSAQEAALKDRGSSAMTSTGISMNDAAAALVAAIASNRASGSGGALTPAARPVPLNLMSQSSNTVQPSNLIQPPSGFWTSGSGGAPTVSPVQGMNTDSDQIHTSSEALPDKAPLGVPETPSSGSASKEPPVVDSGEEAFSLGDPQELARLEEEEQEYYQPQQLWEGFRKRYPKIQAFDSANGCEILTIKPQDIGLLPRENWNYGNNSFLLHGYYNYRYLVLARIGGDGGKRIRYILGVPGNYYSNEKYMASMFGFPHFVLSKKQPSQDGRFGYWYTDIRLQNQD